MEPFIQLRKLRKLKMDNVRYMYVRDMLWQPCGCLAIKIFRNQNKVKYGLSMRNPKDARDSNGRQVKFDRIQARKMACDRLENSTNQVFVPSYASQHDVSQAVLGHIIVTASAPARAIRFAKHWMRLAERFLDDSLPVTTRLPIELRRGSLLAWP